MGESSSATAKHAVGAKHAAIMPSPVQQRAFPGRPDQVGEARRFLAEILADCPADCPAGLAAGCPAGDDAVLCLSELAANAAIHSYSARPGGYFTVRVRMTSSGRLRVEVSDAGGPWTWPESGDHQHGRGFVIMGSLVRAWGRRGDSTTGWTVWFEMECP